MKLLLLFIILTATTSAIALEYSKIDFEGCPENSFCKKETGAYRKKWLQMVKAFSKGEISEQKINTFIQSEFGIPIAGWGTEEASLLPNILMWDSPCKQHKNAAAKYYISEVFKKNVSANEIKESPTLVFARAIMQENGKEPYPMVVIRGDAPLFIKDGSLFFLREEEGIFYGLLIDKEGKIKVIKNEPSPFPPKEVICPKEMIAQFQRLAPSPNFYQGQFCKEIWNKNTKTYQTMLLGWSCN
jgi:hypothetical protein